MTAIATVSQTRCELRILGPFEVRRDGSTLKPLPPRARALLAVLAIHAGRVVSIEQLLDELWPDGPPRTARNALQVHVAAVRRSVGDTQVETHSAGYRLSLDGTEIDARTFEHGLRDALRAERPDPSELRSLLGLWRGDALAEFADVSCARVEAARLEELRVSAQEALCGAELARGRAGQALGDVRLLAERHPHRETVQGLLMRALYASGRQAEALEEYRRTRDRLVEQLGIEPGPELRQLHIMMLRQDPALDISPAREPIAVASAPVPSTPIVGRDRELDDLRTLLGDPLARLITITGAGGVGKTRLVVELARERCHGDAAFVSLSSVERAEHVAWAISRALSVQLLPSEPIEQALFRHLSGSATLLILDTFEHVLDATPLVVRLLDASPGLTVLVTSREPLHLRAEHILRVSPLPYEGDGTGTAANLFASFAAARGIELASSDADAIHALCRRLDGLPLAIELAVGRLGLLGPAELAERLSADLALLGPGPRDAAARHRTLTATIEWSHALLSPAERAAFEALSVFAGGARLDTAEEVTGAALPVLEALADKHLVERADGQSGRLTMLDTIRAFARQRLNRSPQAAAIYRRHAEHCISAVTAISAKIERTHAPDALAAFDRELDDYRAAVIWTIARPEPELALQLSARLAYPCWARYLNEEPLGWLERALALGGTPAARAAALNATAFLLAYRPDGEARAKALAAAQESIALRRSLHDQAGTAESLFSLAKVQLFMDRSDEAYATACEAEQLALASASEPALLNALHARTLAARSLEEALALGDQLASRLRAAGNTWRLAELRSAMVYCAALPHDAPDVAVRLAAEGLAAATQSGDAWKIAGASGNAGLAALCSGRYDEAAAHFSAEVQWFLNHSAWSADLVYEGLNGLSAAAAAQRHDELAARLSGAADAVTSERHKTAIAQRLESRFFTPARARLGDESWAAAYATGRAWTPEQAYAEAHGALCVAAA